MKKKLFAFVFAIILCFSSGICAYADDYLFEEISPLLDGAMLLTDSEKNEVNNSLAKLSEENGMDFAVVTVLADELGSTDITVYADVLYKNYYHNRDVDGTVILVYSHGGEGEREICIVRYGKAEDEFTDGKTSDIVDAVKSEIISGDYAQAFSVFVKESDKVLNPKISWIVLPICLAIGFVIAFIIMKAIASANKSVRNKVNAAEYVRSESLNVVDGSEIYLYSQTRAIPKASSSNSSSRTSGGGRATRSGKF